MILRGTCTLQGKPVKPPLSGEQLAGGGTPPNPGLWSDDYRALGAIWARTWRRCHCDKSVTWHPCRRGDTPGTPASGIMSQRSPPARETPRKVHKRSTQTTGHNTGRRLEQVSNSEPPAKYIISLSPLFATGKMNGVTAKINLCKNKILSTS